MIKEKHEKGGGGDGVKEEPGGSEKEPTGGGGGEVRVKKEDDATASSIKKEAGGGGGGRPTTKNGGVIGSTNMGSLHEIKTESEDVGNAQQADATVKDELDADLPADAFGMTMASSGAPGAAAGCAPDGVQPLPSNVISKQPSSMEVQYMQQQSQIFVFSTMLANAGAEEVIQGRFPSIIAYHCSQPGTKKYLEKNPLKMAQFNRQNPGQWLNTMAAAKNKNNAFMRSPCLGPPNIGGGGGGAPPGQQTQKNAGGGGGGALDFLGGDPLDDIGLGDGDLPWDQKNNHQLEGLENGLPDVSDMDACSPSLSNMQPSLQGVKVPDENLTPQQRQHREEQLATIRKLQQMLCPENQGGGGAGSAGGGSDVQAGGAPPGANQQPPSENIDLPQGLPPGAMQGPPPQQQQQQQQQPNPNSMMHSPMDWHKMQYFEKTGKPMPRGAPPPTGGPGGGPRLQGPPPPYHQTPRSASVPIALQSPNPASPNNPTSNLSLPSPSRASSALNSPADTTRPFGLTRHMSTGQSPTSQDSPSRPNHSNPGTPIASHLSPSVNTTEASTTHPSSGDGLFGRTLQSMAQQQKQMSVPVSGANMVAKEPNLMPVPSPQQIQYLNAFEGQELIIQKQPNTSLNKDGNMISPPILPTTMDSGFPGNNDMPHNRLSGPNTPTSLDVGPRFPGTPSDGCRFSIPSPHTPSGADKPNRHSGSSPQTGGDPLKNEIFPTPSPHMMDVPRFPGPSPSPGNKMGPGGFVNVSPSAGGGKPNAGPPMDMPNYGCVRGDNVPLNPNCTSAMPGNPKVSHFDPISSLAQMSQQLTNSVASSLNGQGHPVPGGPGGMMNFGSPSMHMMEMGGCHGMLGGDMVDPGGGGMMGMPMQGPPHGFHPNSPMGGPIRSLSPKLPGAFTNHMPMPRMMGRPPGPNPYNGANVQVKPNAPNTIQYMPAKSQVGIAPGPPRGPPSVEFLQRYANPMHPGGGGGGMEPQKMPGPNMQYFANCGGHNNGPGMPMQGHMGGHMDGGPPMQDVGPPMMGPNMGMMPMMRPMRPPMQQGMMRMPMGGDPGMFNPGGGGGGGGPMQNPNAQMFVAGPKGSPMGMGGGGGGAPDASQPLPPSMSQSNSFKNSPFVGPTTADPNYAQQFHNFQQQLYATGTRNQMGQAMGPGPGPPHPQHHHQQQQQQQQPPYFPK